MPGDAHGPIGFRHHDESVPPAPRPAGEVAITRFEHVYEVDPTLMERWVLQQTFPNWDTLRIVDSRHDHLEWMHRHFAERVVHASEILAELDDPAADHPAANHPAPDHQAEGATP